MKDQSDYKLVSQFLGYVNKADVTNIDQRYLIAPSQNALINDGEKISIRGGYTLVGGADASADPVQSSHDWLTSGGVERNLRKHSTYLEVLYNDTWETLMTVTSAANLNFAEWWSTSEAKDLLLFADGSANTYMWSGAITTFASATTNTLTKQGTATWAEDRFLLAGTRGLRIKDSGGTWRAFTYTGGETTTTLTGVSPDPTGFTFTVGAVAMQDVRTDTSTISAAYNVSLIKTLDNYVYYGDLERRDVYVSKNTDYTDFGFTGAGRLPGEGAVLTLDNTPVAFEVQEKSMYISGAANDWYQATFTPSADLTNENLSVERLKNGAKQGALSQSAVGKMKNLIVFVSNDLSIEFLGQVENIASPQVKPLSDPIKAEVASYDVTLPPHVYFSGSRLHIAFPSEGKMLIYETERQYWQPPQILPVRRLGTIAGNLAGHSAISPETYSLFSGTADNGNPIDFKVRLAYRNYGYRARLKTVGEWYTEGYLAANTALEHQLDFEYQGAAGSVTETLEGGTAKILFTAAGDPSLGQNPFGAHSLGSTNEEMATMEKFRSVLDLSTLGLDFYELSELFSCYQDDAQCEILASGGLVRLSESSNINIKNP